MRALSVFCAVAFGMGTGASATELGLASFYGAQGLTAAHRSLPMGSRVRVLNLDNGRSVIVRIADRGPFIRGRIIDVSTAVAVTLGFREAGLAHVRIERISAETLEASAEPSRPAAPASDGTSSYAICSYGADRLDHLRSDPVGDRAAPLSGDALGCETFRLPVFRARRECGRRGAHRRRSRKSRFRRAGEGREHPRERPRGYGGGREHPRRRAGRSFAARSPGHALCEPLRGGGLQGGGAAARFEHNACALRGTWPGVRVTLRDLRRHALIPDTASAHLRSIS